MLTPTTNTSGRRSRTAARRAPALGRGGLDHDGIDLLRSGVLEHRVVAETAKETCEQDANVAVRLANENAAPRRNGGNTCE
jgi:hypothetical protein